jgi:hypothetical protein
MSTPFDPKVMTGADDRAKALETVAIAIAQVKLLAVYAQAQDDAIEAQQRGLQPVVQFSQQRNSDLSRQHYDLKDVQTSLSRYLNDLNGRQVALKLGQPGSTLPLPAVPADIAAYVQSIKDGKPYDEPVHTGV